MIPYAFRKAKKAKENLSVVQMHMQPLPEERVVTLPNVQEIATLPLHLLLGSCASVWGGIAC